MLLTRRVQARITECDQPPPGVTPDRRVGALGQRVNHGRERTQIISFASGGDGYPVTISKPGYATQDVMDQVLAGYLTANDPVSPFVKAAPDGRVNCTDSNGPG